MGDIWTKMEDAGLRKENFVAEVPVEKDKGVTEVMLEEVGRVKELEGEVEKVVENAGVTETTETVELNEQMEGIEATKVGATVLSTELDATPSVNAQSEREKIPSVTAAEEATVGVSPNPEPPHSTEPAASEEYSSSAVPEVPSAAERTIIGPAADTPGAAGENTRVPKPTPDSIPKATIAAPAHKSTPTAGPTSEYSSKQNPTLQPKSTSQPESTAATNPIPNLEIHPESPQ